MADKKFSGHIKQATQECFIPSSLRIEFGDALAIEIIKAYKIVDKTDDALSRFILELRQAGTDERRMQLLDAIWRRHYEVVADKIIDRN